MGFNSWFREVREVVLGSGESMLRRMSGPDVVRSSTTRTIRGGVMRGAAIAVVVLGVVVVPDANAVATVSATRLEGPAAGGLRTTAVEREQECSPALTAAIERWWDGFDERLKLANTLFVEASGEMDEFVAVPADL